MKKRKNKNFFIYTIVMSVISAFGYPSSENNNFMHGSFHNTNSDVTFSGDHANKHESTYTLNGNVVLTQDSTTLKSETASLYYRKTTASSNMILEKAVAIGNVNILKTQDSNHAELKATCEKVTFFPEKKLLILVGNAKVWREDEFVHAQTIEINIETGDLKFKNPRGKFATKKE